MKVRFVWMTPSKGMMFHLLPDIMLIPTESSFAIVAGWLNMHLSFKFKRKQKRLEGPTLYFQFKEPVKAMKQLREALAGKGGSNEVQ